MNRLQAKVLAHRRYRKLVADIEMPSQTDLYRAARRQAFG